MGGPGGGGKPTHGEGLATMGTWLTERAGGKKKREACVWGGPYGGEKPTCGELGDGEKLAHWEGLAVGKAHRLVIDPNGKQAKKKPNIQYSLHSFLVSWTARRSSFFATTSPLAGRRKRE
ncbi:hypothetical protein GUJ93_ZPchr0013g37082 [Zizania palustris]|uniref:Uncharacterized protein n=1 Tax=Zizania palustris TaxID=103762 RepID=A0A8J6BYJ1_ZIZPA|nr:hypothetical protein GUJ93_ZPchr0013g37082 [Zizania palustris]